MLCCYCLESDRYAKGAPGRCDKAHFGMETNAFFSTSLTQRAFWIQISGLSAAAYKIRFQKYCANLKL